MRLPHCVISPATRWHRTIAALLALGILIGWLGKSCFEPDGWLGPVPPRTYLSRQNDILLVDSEVFFDWRDVFLTFELRDFSPRDPLAVATADYGYLRDVNGGPRGLKRWFGIEEIWCDVQPRTAHFPTERPATPIDLAAATPQVLTCLHLSATVTAAKPTLGITPATRTWINWRGIGDWCSDLIIWLCSLGLLLPVAVEALRHSRNWSLRQGVCPKCAYSLIGIPDLVCPECGGQLSVLERVTLDYRFPTQPSPKLPDAPHDPPPRQGRQRSPIAP